MRPTFSAKCSSRGKHGIVSIFGSVLLFLVGAGGLLAYWVFPVEPQQAIPSYAAFVLAAIALIGLFFVIWTVGVFCRDTTWELRGDGRRLQWVIWRDQREILEAEVDVADVEALHALFYDGEPGVYFKLELNHPTSVKIDPIYLDTETQIKAFLDYWRLAHPRKPVLDPDGCLQKYEAR